jgi:S1-C subfamily serine protease
MVNIERVAEESLAQKAGLLAADKIVKLNGRDIHSRHALIRLTRSLDWGSVATLTIIRGGKPREIKIELLQ